MAAVVPWAQQKKNGDWNGVFVTSDALYRLCDGLPGDDYMSLRTSHPSMRAAIISEAKRRGLELIDVPC